MDTVNPITRHHNIKRMNYREATLNDALQIAQLHAGSWQRTYRGLFNDDFLDNEALTNRIDTWNTRLSNQRTDQFVFVAEEHGEIKGFVCAYGADDEKWGSLIDNLHVTPEHQKRGVGRQLMRHTFLWLKDHFPTDGVYLWVMETNQAARNFYEKLGAINAGLVDKTNPVGGGSAFNCRYVWDLASSLNIMRDSQI